MKIGMIVECGLGGADAKVYSYLAKKLRPDISLARPSTLGNKKNLIEQCGEHAKGLLEIEGCERVIIVWDLQPRMQRNGKTLCIVEECDLIRDSLKKAGLTAQQKQCVHLVCIKQTLEALLLADERAIAAYLNEKRKGHPCKVDRWRYPEREKKPKGILRKIFQDAGRIYEDMRDAEEIIRRVDIRELWRCSSFERFASKVADIKHPGS